MKETRPRVAYFPDAFLELDGVGRTSRQFEDFAHRRGLPFLIVHGGSHDSISTTGSVTRVQVRRSRLRFSLDRAHDYDLIFLRRLRKVRQIVRDFQPDVVQITGPSDVGVLGMVIAHHLRVPLAASWQTNLDQYARSRAAAVVSFLPQAVSSKLLGAVEQLSFRACTRFYKVPQLLFAPNQEIIQRLEQATGKPCLLMDHAVDTEAFSPAFRTRPKKGPLRIGYAGRLTAEKNVAALVALERSLREQGHRDFQMVVIGQGAKEKWLREHLQQAEFTGVLRGRDLAQAFANLDILVFPSETDTFGLVVLEALASGVPAVVTAKGGPKFVVRHGSSGFVARTFEEFVSCTAELLTRPELLATMRTAARQQALGTDWDGIFDKIYETYESRLLAAADAREPVFDVATN